MIILKGTNYNKITSQQIEFYLLRCCSIIIPPYPSSKKLTKIYLNLFKSLNFIWILSCSFLMLLSQCSIQLLFLSHNNSMDYLKFLQDNSSILTQQSCRQQSTLLCLQIFITSWRIESDMFFVDESNKIRYSYNTVFQKCFCDHLRLLSSLYCVLSDLMNQIFILNIHHSFERSHLCSRMLSIIIVYKKVINRFFKLYLSFWWSFAEVKKFWTVLLNASTAPWCWGL